ncbi:uncharacterized protein LOC119999762 isoform X2 [Tripterygium wilfordii]|uniref:uncharacterized protein LOC119999762 isoform X2 n=1 Tax=Tripterygium wilfordii TaxID=458696 RepID=UPI0018F8197E|nr:uncharacterized protein LOC119999762 isoform X2 [Tripterygium wilfordii]
MSRCFPYPPPGYVRSDSRGVALIESIKLKRENEKAKSELTKEKKRQRQQRKKEKKERKKAKFFDISDDAVKKLSGEKLCQVEKSGYDLHGGCILKGKNEEAEQLERSSLTEEHGMPVSPQSVGYLSDGTQSSKKRKASSSDGRNIVRIKLTLRKHKEPNAMDSGEQSCSTSGRADSHVQCKENTCVPDQKQWSSAKQSVARLDKEKSCLDLAEVPALDRRAKSYQNKMQKTESLYRNLIQEWLPPSIQLGQENLDDQDWLFGVKRENGNDSKGIAASQDVARCRSPTLWPCAHYLPEANIFALPFTVPF